MKRLFFLVSTLIAAALAMTGCGSAPNVNTSSARNAANTAINAVANVANAVTNAAAKAATDSPEDFLKASARSGMNEVEMSKLAASKAKNPELKKFAQMLVSHHETINTEVKALAGKKNITLPAATDADQSGVEELKKVTGDQFDNTYIDAMIDGHESSVSAFQKQADGSTDPDVKAFAAKTLPTLKGHLERIKAIQLKMASSAKMDN